MNANELADIVDRWAYKESAEYLTDAAAMLRQQQAQIEALKQQNTNLIREAKSLIKESLSGEDFAMIGFSEVGTGLADPNAFTYDPPKIIRQQQAEIEALKMGFANNGTSDSELAEVRALANRWFLDAARYQWLRAEFAAGRETYLAEGIPNGEELDKYIDRKANK
jgi:hypothetical protein